MLNLTYHYENIVDRGRTPWAVKISITFPKLSTAHKSKFPKPISSKLNYNKEFLWLLDAQGCSN
jgi:hypothetical protein